MGALSVSVRKGDDNPDQEARRGSLRVRQLCQDWREEGLSNGEGTPLQGPWGSSHGCWSRTAASKEVKPEVGQQMGEELGLDPHCGCHQPALSRDITWPDSGYFGRRVCSVLFSWRESSRGKKWETMGWGGGVDTKHVWPSSHIPHPGAPAPVKLHLLTIWPAPTGTFKRIPERWNQPYFSIWF